MAPRDSTDDESAGSTEAAPASAPLSLDTAFDVLAEAEHRVILTYLSESSDSVGTLTELAQELGTQPTNHRRTEPTPRTAKIQLHHHYLPKLASIGLVEYDTRSEQVRYWPDEQLETWLQRVQADKDD